MLYSTNNRYVSETAYRKNTTIMWETLQEQQQQQKRTTCIMSLTQTSLYSLQRQQQQQQNIFTSKTT